MSTLAIKLLMPTICGGWMGKGRQNMVKDLYLIIGHESIKNRYEMYPFGGFLLWLSGEL